MSRPKDHGAAPLRSTLDAVAAQAKASSGILVALDQVVDPQNLGSILRAAAAFGAAGVLFTKDRSSPLTEAAQRVSVGASEIVPHVVVTNLVRELQRLKQQGFWVAGASLAADAQPLDEVEVPTPTVLVMGSEHSGLRRLVAENCDLLVKIPMRGEIQSLNVGQAAAILLYELQRRAAAASSED